MKNTDGLALQIAFKPNDLRAAIVSIVDVALSSNHEFWPDDQEFLSVPPDSRNAIGNGFKVLLSANIIEKTGAWRNSQRSEQKGRIVWGWRLKSRVLAETLLKNHNAAPLKGQMDLSL
jgi:hypothetical protein